MNDDVKKKNILLEVNQKQSKFTSELCQRTILTYDKGEPHTAKDTYGLNFLCHQYP